MFKKIIQDINIKILQEYVLTVAIIREGLFRIDKNLKGVIN